MSNDTTPKRPAGLSGQEEEDLRALEKGYDPDGSALPDPDHSDDPTRKPGDDSVGEQGRRSSAGGVAAGSSPSSSPSKPLADAERRGLLPSGDAATPPMDRPDDSAPGAVDLDPDPRRRRP
jgi:hypothetical protein